MEFTGARAPATRDMSQPFVGSSLALTDAGVSSAAAGMEVPVHEIWAVIAVETPGCGFFHDRRPQILYERHVFHTLTRGRFDDGDISDPRPGGYGRRGAHQYARLSQAMEVSRAAALRSASWGLGQILGKNCEMAGFADVDAFVRAMSHSEDAQLAAVARFITSAGLDKALRTHDWVTFARRYNGPAYARNRYDERLDDEYRRYVVDGVPDLRVRAAQLYLRYLGFKPGPVDGVVGPSTHAAVLAYQTREGLPTTGVVDDTLIAMITPA